MYYLCKMLQVKHKLTLHFPPSSPWLSKQWWPHSRAGGNGCPPCHHSGCHYHCHTSHLILQEDVSQYIHIIPIIFELIKLATVVLWCSNYNYTSREARQRRASLLWRAINGVSVKALWRQCFIESTFNFSYVDDRELGNWSKGMPMAMMWQCFRVITCKACMHIMIELARHAPCTWTCLCMTACRTQADA